jgi:hypothetical protein
MARRGSALASRPGPRGLLTGVLVVVLVALSSSGCTSDSSDPPRQAHNAALRVTTVPGSHLDESERAQLESEVSDVLARYVQAGFLGTYPRSDFVQSFAGFSSGAAEQAVGDIEVLTASRFKDATSVRATGLDVALSFLVVKGTAVGATAWIDFDFDVHEDGARRTAALVGRLTLDRGDGHWSVFGYDVRRDDSDALPAEVSSS